MTNKPQSPPEATVWPIGVPRPTSPPPPKKKEPMNELDAMRHNWLKALEQSGRIRKISESLHKEVRDLRKRLGVYECPLCGETDRETNRYIHEVSSEPTCFECGGCWE